MNDSDHSILNHPYADILFTPRHVSTVYQHMALESRAVQFAPFAALPGHSDVLEETARFTEHPCELADDERVWLDKMLASIMHTPHRKASITYLRPDRNKSGGHTVTVSGSIVSVDPLHHTVRLSDGTAIAMDLIRKITSA